MRRGRGEGGRGRGSARATGGVREPSDRRTKEERQARRQRPQHESRASGDGKGGRQGTHLVRVLVRPAVDAVVGGVEAALGEPLDVARLEPARADRLKVAVPIERLLGRLRRGGPGRREGEAREGDDERRSERRPGQSRASEMKRRTGGSAIGRGQTDRRDAFCNGPGLASWLLEARTGSRLERTEARAGRPTLTRPGVRPDELGRSGSGDGRPSVRARIGRTRGERSSDLPDDALVPRACSSPSSYPPAPEANGDRRTLRHHSSLPCWPPTVCLWNAWYAARSGPTCGWGYLAVSRASLVRSAMGNAATWSPCCSTCSVVLMLYWGGRDVGRRRVWEGGRREEGGAGCWSGR